MNQLIYNPDIDYALVYAWRNPLFAEYIKIGKSNINAVQGLVTSAKRWSPATIEMLAFRLLESDEDAYKFEKSVRTRFGRISKTEFIHATENVYQYLREEFAVYDLDVIKQLQKDPHHFLNHPNKIVQCLNMIPPSMDGYKSLESIISTTDWESPKSVQKYIRWFRIWDVNWIRKNGDYYFDEESVAIYFMNHVDFIESSEIADIVAPFIQWVWLKDMLCLVEYSAADMNFYNLQDVKKCLKNFNIEFDVNTLEITPPKKQHYQVIGEH